MPDVFLKADVRAMLANKKIALLGCSNVRALYKDLVCLWQHDQLVSNARLRSKMEKSHMGDVLVCHGKQHNGRDYREERVFRTNGGSISFFFLTRVWNDYVRSILDRLADDAPDVVAISSCLWDITRWGPNGVQQYKGNLEKLFAALRDALPRSTLLIWLTAPPLSQDVRGGFLIAQLEFLKYSLRFHVLEANLFCRGMADRFGVDTLDLHFHLRLLLDLRADDGIHWLPMAVRLCTNLLLGHIALSWGQPLPNRCGFLTEQERQAAPPEASTDLDHSLPADLSFGTIFGDDSQLLGQVVRNATEPPVQGRTYAVPKRQLLRNHQPPPLLQDPSLAGDSLLIPLYGARQTSGGNAELTSFPATVHRAQSGHVAVPQVPTELRFWEDPLVTWEEAGGRTTTTTPCAEQCLT
ncbi:unnamed protein product [Ixodes hexagonus]